MATFLGSAAAVKYIGTAGVEDTITYEASPIPVGVYLSGGGSPFGWGVGDTFESVENVIGTNFADFISGDGRNNKLYGRGGHDSIYGFAAAGSTTFLYGEDGEDTLIAGAGIDILDGGAEEDTVSYLLSPTGVTISLANPAINTGWAAGDVYISIQDVIGSDFNDIIYGSTEGLLNQLQGQVGNDRLFGGTGYNVLIGGIGADELNGAGTGNLIDYETATSGVTASMANPSINTGDAAGDTYINLFGRDLAGSPFADVLYGDEGNNNIIGDPDRNIYGRTDNDQLYGNGGNDTLEGSGGADRLDGGAGFDVAAYANSPIGLTVSLANPSVNTGEAAGDTFFGVEGIIGTRFNDILTGDGLDNVLFGGEGNDQLSGGAGNDTFSSGAGADALNGGDGFDVATYSDATAGFTASLADSSRNTGLAAGDTYTFIESLVGSNFNDYLIGDTNVNVIQGGSGNDIIEGGGGSDLLLGDAGDDIIIAGQGTSDLRGGTGNDTFRFMNVNDSIATVTVAPTVINDFVSGSDKIDISQISPTSVQIVQENGFFTVRAAAAGGTLSVRATSQIVMSDVITSIPGQTLTGTAGYDLLVGGGGADRITGGGTGDVLTGGPGNDTFVYLALSDSSGASYDIISDFQRGVDKIDLTAIAPNYISIIHANGASFLFPAQPSGGTMLIAVAGDVEGPDIIGAPNLFIVGDSIADTLIGGAGSDTIIGNAGDDIIIGGGSGDALSGNGGADTFRFLSAAESNPQALDIIQDFASGTDVIDLIALAPTNISVLSLNGGALVSGIASNGGIFQFATTTNVTGTDILGLTGGLYFQGDGGANTLTGSVLADNIYGGDGNDILIGGLGADALFGQGGADTFRYLTASQSSPSGFDIIQDFQTGTDKLDLSALGITGVSITRTSGGTFVTGAAPSGVFQVASTRDINPGDILGLTTGPNFTGDGGNNILIGSGFNETIDAGAGNDIIIGGGGADALFGGTGADVFRYLNKSDSTPAAADIIQDFQTGVDKVDLTAVRTGGSDSFALLHDASASYLFFDLGGDGTNDIQILFTNPNVQTSDLML